MSFALIASSLPHVRFADEMVCKANFMIMCYYMLIVVAEIEVLREVLMHLKFLLFYYL
jgi:hypothetical protein